MAQNQQSDVPPEIREFAAQNIAQAQAAYNQLLEAARKAQEMMKTLMPSSPLAAGMSDVEERAMRFAQQNLDAGFSLANELTKAKDLKEALQIQSRHAQLQMHAYALQAQELGAMINEASQKAKLGGK
jgi:phasin